jgi:hypothetical protein
MRPRVNICFARQLTLSAAGATLDTCSVSEAEIRGHISQLARPRLSAEASWGSCRRALP